jgi:hypothetical protein
MIKCDKEYSVTRYWRNMFRKDYEKITDFEQNAMESVIASSYQSMDDELSAEMIAYLNETGKIDEDFPIWTPEESGETAILIKN